MKQPIYWEDVINDLMSEFPYQVHMFTDTYSDIEVIKQQIGDNGVIVDRIGLPVDQEYAEACIRMSGDVHFDVYSHQEMEIYT